MMPKSVERCSDVIMLYPFVFTQFRTQDRRAVLLALL